MTTQVSFTADEKLKEKALEKAKAEGITLKAFFVFSMKAFVDGKLKLGIFPPEEPEIEEIMFSDKNLQKKATKLAKLLD